MRYVEKTRTWDDNWNNMIRYVLFQDDKLKSLMLLPDGVDLMRFISKYFIEMDGGSQIVTDEKVRILYYDSDSSDSGNKNVLTRFKHFDIYVKENVLHSQSSDRMKYLYHDIKQRLKYLILNYCHEYGLSFRFLDSYNLWTKTPGYRRYHVIFTYHTTT